MARPVLMLSACAAIFLSGCFVGNQTLNVPADISLQSVAPKLSGSPCTIHLRDATAIEADSAKFGSDSVTVWPTGRNTLNEFPLESVWKISTRSAGRGAFLGLLWGTLAGAAVGAAAGAIWGLASDDEPLLWDGPQTTGEKAGALAAGLGIVGGLTGGIAGYIVGGRTEYTLAPDSLLKLDPVTPWVTLIVPRLESEDETTVSIIWGDRLLHLPKEQIVIKRVQEGVYIKLPRHLFEARE